MSGNLTPGGTISVLYHQSWIDYHHQQHQDLCNHLHDKLSAIVCWSILIIMGWRWRRSLFADQLVDGTGLWAELLPPLLDWTHLYSSLLLCTMYVFVFLCNCICICLFMYAPALTCMLYSVTILIELYFSIAPSVVHRYPSRLNLIASAALNPLQWALLNFSALCNWGRDAKIAIGALCDSDSRHNRPTIAGPDLEQTLLIYPICCALSRAL